MKKLMLLALVAISINVSAQMRGNDPVWLQTGEKNFTNWVDAADKAQAPAVFAKYVNLPWEERLAKLEEVSGTFKFISLGKWEGNGVAQRDERNIGVKMYVISLAKEFKNKNYGDRVVPMYAFESGKGAMDYNQTLVLSIDNNLNGIMDDLMRDPKTGKLGVRDNTSGRQPIPMVDMMALVDEVQGTDADNSKKVVATGDVLLPGSIYESNGQQFEVTYDENGKQTFRLLTDAGDGNVQKKKASRTETVEIEGDQELLTQAGDVYQGGSSDNPNDVAYWNQRVTNPDGTTSSYERGGRTNGEWREKATPAKDTWTKETFGRNDRLIVTQANGDVEAELNDKILKLMIKNNYDLVERTPTKATEILAANKGTRWAPAGMTWNGGGWIQTSVGFGGCTNLPVVGNGGCGTTYVRDCDDVAGLNAAAVSKQIWMQQNSYLYGGRGR